MSDEDAAEELIGNFNDTLKEETMGCDYVWQVVGSLSQIEKSHVTFITDMHVFLHGQTLFQVLTDGFAAVRGKENIELVNLTAHA